MSSLVTCFRRSRATPRANAPRSAPRPRGGGPGRSRWERPILWIHVQLHFRWQPLHKGIQLRQWLRPPSCFDLHC
eukprot:1248135-Lingulodinium_polyedra.AAC.1